MNTYDFTVNQLRDLLKKFYLGESDTKAELIARLDATFSREKWLATMQKKMAEDAESPSNVAENATFITPTSGSVLSNNQTCPLQNESALFTRELEFMHCERELMQRKLDLARRENELLRNTLRSEVSVRMPSNVTLKLQFAIIYASSTGQEIPLQYRKRKSRNCVPYTILMITLRGY